MANTAMNIWMQHLLVLLIVATCIAVVARQFYATLLGRKSRLGQCCARGCATASNPQPETRTAHLQFLPAELLIKPRK